MENYQKNRINPFYIYYNFDHVQNIRLKCNNIQNVVYVLVF